MIADTRSDCRNRCRQVLLTGLAALLCLGVLPAQASFRPGAVVLTMGNTSTYSGHLLDRRAADQLALDLGATGVWRVIDRAQTDRATQQRDLRPPYATAYLQELAHALQGDVVFTGTVQKLEVVAKEGKLAVTVYVEALDQISGQIALATLQTGEARRNDRTPEPTDVLIGQALADATAKVAAVAARSTGIIATVIDPDDAKQITLKLPTGAVVKSGYRFLLYRAVPEGEERVPGKLIATLMVTTVNDGQSMATVLAKAGDIHTDDIAVSICGAAKE